MNTAGHSLPGEHEARETIERSFAHGLRQIDAALALGLKLIERTPSFVLTDKRSKNSGIVIMGLYVKALKTVRAIRLVASADLVEDGLVLCRTLLETTVAVLYVLQKNTAQRAEEYLASTLMRTKSTMEDWERTKGLKRDGRRIHQLVLKWLPPYERHLGSPRLQQLRRSYSGKSIKKTFDALHLSRHYLTSYARLSMHQHAADLSSHVVLEDGAIQLKVGSSDALQMRFLLDITRLFVCSLMHRVSQAMELGYEAEIDALKPHARDLEQSRLRAWSHRMKARRSVTKR